MNEPHWSLPPRFKTVEDAEKALKGDYSQSIRPFVQLPNGDVIYNKEYLEAEYEIASGTFNGKGQFIYAPLPGTLTH